MLPWLQGMSISLLRYATSGVLLLTKAVSMRSRRLSQGSKVTLTCRPGFCRANAVVSGFQIFAASLVVRGNAHMVIVVIVLPAASAGAAGSAARRASTLRLRP